MLWTAQGDTTEVKVARSGDGGRSFAAPVMLQSQRRRAASRGWPAVALDHQANIHAIWIDHRGLAKDGATGANHSGHKGEHDGVAMAQKSGLYYASMAERSLARTRADQQRLLLLQDGTGCRRGRVAVCRLAARLPWKPARHGIHDVPRRRTLLLTSRPYQRGRMGGQWVPRRWAGDCGGRTRRGSFGVADSDRWRQAGRRDLLHIDTRWPALHTTRPHPNARRTQTVAPADCRRPCRTDLRRVGQKRKGTPRLGSAGVAASARWSPCSATL